MVQCSGIAQGPRQAQAGIGLWLSGCAVVAEDDQTTAQSPETMRMMSMSEPMPIISRPNWIAAVTASTPLTATRTRRPAQLHLIERREAPHSGREDDQYSAGCGRNQQGGFLRPEPVGLPMETPMHRQRQVRRNLRVSGDGDSDKAPSSRAP